MKNPPPDPGVGYRLLKPARGKFRGEFIRDGDEFLLNGKWYASTQDGDRQGKIGARSRGGHPWRRRRTDEPIPAVEALEQVAGKIVRDLFTLSGDGTMARRLVLEGPRDVSGGQGGYIQTAVYSRVLAILTGR